MDLASYYLFKEGVTLDFLFDQIGEIKKGNNPKYDYFGEFEFTVDEFSALKGHAFTYQDTIGTPKWYSLIRSLVQEQLPNRYPSSSHAGIIICQCHERQWGLVFGHSYRDIEELPVEMRFGRIAISNAIDNTEALRGFVGQTFGRNAKIRIESTANDGPLDRLSFLEQSNRLKKLRARVIFDKENFLVEGGISFRFPRAESADQLIAILSKLKAWWHGGKELNDEIAEKDPVFEIRDKSAETYEDEYEEALHQSDAQGFFLNFDLEEYWTAQSFGLKLGRERIAEIGMPDTDIVLSTARKYLDLETDSHKLRLVFDLPNGSQERPLRSVLSYERPQKEGEPFIVVKDEGCWWEYRSSWVRRMQTAYEFHLKKSKRASEEILGQFSEFRRENLGKDPEGEWIGNQKRSIKSAEVLHVVSNIKVPGSKSPVELADLFMPTNTLLSVKRGNDLKKIDEVAGQVEAAARMLVRQPEYSDKVIKLLAELKVDLNINDRNSIKFGCVTIARGMPTSIRAKERIVQFFQTMTDFNFEPVWIFVEAKP